MRRNIAIIVLSLFAFVLLAVNETEAEEIKMHRTKAMIYDGPGASKESASKIREILLEMGISSSSIILAENVSSCALSGSFPVDLLVFPGGWAPDYNKIINQEGFAAIREFVNKGGVYVGICAGAYFAAKEVLWEGKKYPYPLGLFRGKAVGPLFPDWKEGRTTLIQQADKRMFVSYIGGPYFLPENNDKIIILAEYIGGKADGKPAALIMTYGDGRIFLCGPHLEYSGKTAKEWFKRVLGLLIGGR